MSWPTSHNAHRTKKSAQVFLNSVRQNKKQQKQPQKWQKQQKVQEMQKMQQQK
jgi:hypothetical protein